MTLYEYLTQERGRATRLAAATGLAHSSISRLMHGTQKPSYEAIATIAKATKGAVSPADWFAPAKPRRRAA